MCLDDFELDGEGIGGPGVCPCGMFQSGCVRPFIFEPVAMLCNGGNSNGSALLGVVTGYLRLGKGRCTADGSFKDISCYNSFSERYLCALKRSSCKGAVGGLPRGDQCVGDRSVLCRVGGVRRGRVLSSNVRCSCIGENVSLLRTGGFLTSGRKYGRRRCVGFTRRGCSGKRASVRCFRRCLRPSTLCLLSRPRISLSLTGRIVLTRRVGGVTELLRYRFVVTARSPFVLKALGTGVCGLSAGRCSIAG